MKRSLLKAAIFVLLLITGLSAQSRMPGKVVEVLDGRTVILETNTGRIKAVLQNIEVPEPEQQLYGVVKDHLSKLLLGKVVEFQPSRILDDRTVGRFMLGGVNVSLQMIRDGAAWHEPESTSGQDPNEALEFKTNQALAKTEKRGIWASTTLKPAWEFRAERYAATKKNAVDDWNVYLRDTSSQSDPSVRSSRMTDAQREQANAQIQLWPEIGRSTKTSDSGFLATYDTIRREGFTATPGGEVNLVGSRSGLKLEFRAIYVYRGAPNAIEESAFIIGFLSESGDYKFTGANELTIVADKQNITIGEARRLYRPVADGVQELLLYKIGKPSLAKIADAKKVVIRLARYNGTIDGKIQPAVRQLVELAN